MKMNEKYYLLTAGVDDSLLAGLRSAHAVTWPQNQLGVSPSLDGSKEVVKVDWGEAIPDVGMDREIPWSEAVRLVESPEWGAA